MEQPEAMRQKLAALEEAGQELRLANEAFFREGFIGTRMRYRRRLLWITVVFVGITLGWTFMACPLLHHRVGWCPVRHVAAP